MLNPSNYGRFETYNNGLGHCSPNSGLRHRRTTHTSQTDTESGSGSGRFHYLHSAGIAEPVYSSHIRGLHSKILAIGFGVVISLSKDLSDAEQVDLCSADKPDAKLGNLGGHAEFLPNGFPVFDETYVTFSKVSWQITPLQKTQALNIDS